MSSSQQVFEAIYGEALKKNETNLDTWNAYKKRLQELRANLSFYEKKLSHQVMVPIGKKAFMKGKIIHTNEVLVSVGASWFTKQSVCGAMGVCERMISRCDKHIQDYEREKELLNNRLSVPLENKVFGDGDLTEIVEPYDEDEEKKWKVKHEKRVREYKQREKKEREIIVSSCDNEVLNELALLELEEELLELRQLAEQGTENASASSARENDKNQLEEKQLLTEENILSLLREITQENYPKGDNSNFQIKNANSEEQNLNSKKLDGSKKVSFAPVVEYENETFTNDESTRNCGDTQKTENTIYFNELKAKNCVKNSPFVENNKNSEYSLNQPIAAKEISNDQPIGMRENVFLSDSLESSNAWTIRSQGNRNNQRIEACESKNDQPIAEEENVNSSNQPITKRENVNSSNQPITSQDNSHNYPIRSPIMIKFNHDNVAPALNENLLEQLKIDICEFANESPSHSILKKCDENVKIDVCEVTNESMSQSILKKCDENTKTDVSSPTKPLRSILKKCDDNMKTLSSPTNEKPLRSILKTCNINKKVGVSLPTNEKPSRSILKKYDENSMLLENVKTFENLTDSDDSDSEENENFIFGEIVERKNEMNAPIKAPESRNERTSLFKKRKNIVNNR